MNQETMIYQCGCSATGTAPIPRYCPEHPRLTADELYRVMQAWEGQRASEEQTRIVIKLGALREGAVRAGDSPFVTPLDQPIPQPLQPPAAATQETCSTCMHLMPFELTDELLTCPVVNIRIHRESAAVFGCNQHEAKTPLQPAAAAPPIDMEPIQRRFDTHYMHCEPGTSQKTMREDMRVLLARLRALQGTTKEDCLWTEDEDGLWTASCDGRPWSTMDGSPPSDNSMRFCPKCGGSLSEKTHDAAALEACDED